ncbi:MAG: stalk domain-containing protein [Defluviitaleaceae bacterium]|nr:stalk domain-containing protein [Defluviitaleaceae bacterium]
MMKLCRRFLVSVFCFSMVLAVAATAFAEVLGEDGVFIPNFSSVSGVVEADFGYMIHVSTPFSTTHFTVDNLTFEFGERLEFGRSVRVYFDSGLMVPAVYPPQYHGVLVLNDENMNVTFTRFDDEGYINAKTPISFQDGRDFRDFATPRDLPRALKGRLIASITCANDEVKHIVVMHETNKPWLPNITVNAEEIEAKWKVLDGEYYLPLRSVANALGVGDSITWDDGSITISNGIETIALSIGSYIFGNIALSHPAVLIGSSTFVPLSFFSHFFGDMIVLNISNYNIH